MYNTRRVISKALFSSKKIYNKEECMKIIAKTAIEMQKIAEITLGPYGRNVLIGSEMQAPRITKDGVTVVKHIEYENRMEDAVATLIKKSVDGTNKYAGDGTTTSTVLIGEIMRIAAKKIAIGVSAREIRKGLEIGRKICIEFLQSCARKITTKQQLINVAMISTNGKTDIANLVVQALFTSGSVKVQKSQKSYNSIQFHTGFAIPRGIESPEFTNTAKKTIVYNYPLVVVSYLPLNHIKNIVKCLQLAKKARKQLMIFAPDFTDAIKSTMIYNNKKKIVQCAYITIPQYGEKGEDLLKKVADSTESYYFNQFSQHKIDSIDWNHFGKAVKIQCDAYQTKLQVAAKDGKQKLQALIMVGGPNQTVMLQNYDHIIDALNSAKSAMKDGVVAGGGVTFWRLSQLLQNYSGQGEQGIKILAQALKQPRRKLMQYIPSQKKPLEGQMWEGYDLKQQKTVDMFEAGIVDSVNVAKSTIIDSISLCTVLVEVQIGLARQSKNISTISLKQLNDKYKL